MKKFESVEVFQGNATGKAGVPSIPFGRGFYQSSNNGSFGIQFTPSGEPQFKTYKDGKHSKKNLKKRMKNFKQFVKESLISNLDSIDNIKFYEGGMLEPNPSCNTGFIFFTENDKKKDEHFSIFRGNIEFDHFYPQQTYFDLVNYIYNKLPEGRIKKEVALYYKDILEPQSVLTEN
jgi:hypothetical protein